MSFGARMSATTLTFVHNHFDAALPAIVRILARMLQITPGRVSQVLTELAAGGKASQAEAVAR